MSPRGKTDGRKYLTGIIDAVDLAPENPGHFRFVLDCPEIASSVMPGQFVHILPPGNHDLLRRPISVLSADEDKGTFTILFRVIGDGTALIAGAKVGDKLDIIGPLGNGFKKSDKQYEMGVVNL